MKITQTKIFEKAFGVLPREAKGAVLEAIEKLQKNPESRGLELKPMHACDSSIREARVTKACRLICHKTEDGWMLLYVDTDHDKALRWAEENCSSGDFSFVENKSGALDVLLGGAEMLCVEDQKRAKLVGVVAQAKAQTEQVKQDRDAALALAEEESRKALRSRDAELEANKRAEFLEKEIARMNSEKLRAGADNEVTITASDWLVAVNERVLFRGSSCTELVLKSGARRYMKTQSFDKDGVITKRAKDLRNFCVRTTCWDPIGQPGKWSNQGYFRNIYMVMELDVAGRK